MEDRTQKGAPEGMDQLPQASALLGGLSKSLHYLVLLWFPFPRFLFSYYPFPPDCLAFPPPPPSTISLGPSLAIRDFVLAFLPADCPFPTQGIPNRGGFRGEGRVGRVERIKV